jgi:AcrR family transcriptional regulator
MLVGSEAEAGDPPIKERILDAAERLYSAKGYSAVTLRDIGSEVGLSHASLYHHFPKGKDQLFVEVIERNIRRHGAGLAAALEAGGGSLRERLYGAADWLLSQPPMDLVRMLNSDMPSLDPAEARRLMDLVADLILRRLGSTIEEARRSGQIRGPESNLLGGAFLGLIESFHSIPRFAIRRPLALMAREVIDVFLVGLEYREDKEVL